MTKNYSLPLKTILLATGIFIGLFLGIFFAALFFISQPEAKPISHFEALSLAINLPIAITAIAAIIFTYASFRRQKNQWLNESFIRREAEILLELRDKLAASSEAAHFFLHDLLVVDKTYGFITKVPPIIKSSTLAKNFNTLVDLNNLYNLHQHIFRKHELNGSIECIPLLLESARNLPERDIEYELIYQSENFQTYRMESSILEMVVMSFNYQAHFLYDIEPGSPPSIEQLNIQKNKDQLQELSRFRELTSQKLLSLAHSLDRLTMYLESESSEAMQSRSMRYFQQKNER
ncbi:hypothetical protein AKN90_02000 [Thiopseudomonas alkaliphila]|uniref:hypothetical protein n=1 Tax=Thiopseudomonas alkaliphila TaxID=1697053 RepID=UPI00069E7D97|nr:hypothetical protein [Thiopseudomonas alkaliphila]AKX54613.1 hypothetical protein AKN90_02000 [Thiopseudomonas alkaliphila]